MSKLVYTYSFFNGSDAYNRQWFLVNLIQHIFYFNQFNLNTSVDNFYLQVSATFCVEFDLWDGCYDNQHAYGHRHKQHDDMAGAVHQRLIIPILRFTGLWWAGKKYLTVKYNALTTSWLLEWNNLSIKVNPCVIKHLTYVKRYFGR